MNRSRTNLFLFAALLIFLCGSLSCSRYRQVSISYKDFLESDSVKAGEIYVSDGIHLYRLNHAEISGDSIEGEIVPEPAGAADKRFSVKEEKETAAPRIILYTRTPLNIEADRGVALPADKSVKLGRNEIFKIKSLRPGEKGMVIFLIFLVLVLTIIAGMIYLVLSVLSAASSSSSNSGSSSSSNNNSACYIATMVYGDCDAPEVLVLRRFRDEVLSRTVAGRLFIQTYYKWSPAFVERFRHSKKVNRYIRIVLDTVIKRIA
ncbi:MAG: CFI-box-CTERM domain-containing protein [Cytophagaceae bacterium]